MASDRNNSYHKAIDRFESLLEMARSREIDTPYKMAQASGIPQSTAYRQIALLEEMRLISRDVQGRFMIGPETLRLSNQAWQVQDIEVLAEPILRFVRIQTRKTAFLGFVADGAIQLGAYSIGLGSSFKRPVKSGCYFFRDVTLPLSPGRFDFFDEKELRHSVILSPISGNEDRELVIGLFETAQKDSVISDDLALVTDAANRLRAGMTLESQNLGP